MIRIGLIALSFSLCSVAFGRDVVRESDFFFKLDSQRLSQGAIQYAYELIDSDEDPTKNKSFRALLAQDFKSEYANRGDESFYVMMVRFAYEVDKDISFFTSKQLTDLKYIQAVMPRATIRQSNANTFEVESSFAKMPSYRFSIMTYSRDQIRNFDPSNPILKALSADPHSETPEVLQLQYADQFGRVMTARTTKMSQVVTRHIPVRKGRTLVVCQVLGYVYNVPPFFVGGKDLIRKEFVSDLSQIPDRISNY